MQGAMMRQLTSEHHNSWKQKMPFGSWLWPLEKLSAVVLLLVFGFFLLIRRQMLALSGSVTFKSCFLKLILGGGSRLLQIASCYP